MGVELESLRVTFEKLEYYSLDDNSSKTKEENVAVDNANMFRIGNHRNFDVSLISSTSKYDF